MELELCHFAKEYRAKGGKVNTRCTRGTVKKTLKVFQPGNVGALKSSV